MESWKPFGKKYIVVQTAVLSIAADGIQNSAAEHTVMRNKANTVTSQIVVNEIYKTPRQFIS